MFCDIVPLLRPPTKHRNARVLQLDVGDPEHFGAGGVEVNPWQRPSELLWPIDSGLADKLVSFDLPLSLVECLEGCLLPVLQISILTYLQAIVSVSMAARDQLNRHCTWPLALPRSSSKALRALAAQVQRTCKQSLPEFGERSASQAGHWTGWASSYDVWLRDCSGCVAAKVRLQGASSKTAAYDMQGTHLTGGRIWAGALLLARWAASLKAPSSRWSLGDGPLLEIGAGIGLAGLALSQLGHRVVLSDREPVLLEALQENIRTNGAERQCRVLPMDWAQAGQPKMRRLLRAQRFSAVIGADLIYEAGREASDLVAGVLRHALPLGGVALLVNALRHRRGPILLGQALRDAGCEVEERVQSCTGALQDLICGEHEPEQEYVMLAVRVPPSEAADAEARVAEG